MLKNMLWIKLGISIFFLVLLIILLCDYWVTNENKIALYDNTENIPENKVGLVLGTIKYLESNQLNLYFKYRIEAAEQLYKSGKVKFLIVSGDNSRYGYNEPKDMKESLVQKGIPEKDIYEDFAGFRTLDSIVRAKEIFGESKFTVISQKFHNERALFIAKRSNINAIAFNAKDVQHIRSLKVKIREYLARVKVVLDIYILNTKPKFSGKKIEIN